MIKLKKLFVYNVNLLLYWISKLIPKDEKIWIFGAWFGDKYGDNSKYLFEYVTNNYPEIKAIWLTKDKSTLEIIQKKGYKVYKTHSFKGYYYSIKASVSFVSTSFNDINHYVFTGIYINLWHGIPLKKIVYDDKLTNSIDYNSLQKKFSRMLFPFIHSPEDFNYIIASSKDETKNLATAFKKNIKDILITGLPRNDVFDQNKRSMKKVIYMPTHRNEGELDIATMFLDDLDTINKNFISLNLELYIKLHYYHMKNIDLQNYSNIFIIKDEDIEQDIYSVINDFDLLITDYSSIYFDFLLTDRPIIFTPFDYEEYLSKDRELYYNYDEVTPGPKCKNWNEVLEWIENFKKDSTLYAKERKIVKDRFHKYQDGKSCERVYNEILKLGL